MPRIDLYVPFAEKDEAKQLGARWDSVRKVWYAPDGVDASALERWLPKEPDITLRSDSYFIAHTVKQCWKCNEHPNVFGFVLPAVHEELQIDDEDLDEWAPLDMPTILSSIFISLRN